MEHPGARVILRIRAQPSVGRAHSDQRRAGRPAKLVGECIGYCNGLNQLPGAAAIVGGQDRELAADRVAKRKPVLAVEEPHGVIEIARVRVEPPDELNPTSTISPVLTLRTRMA